MSSKREAPATSLGEETRKEVLDARCEEETRFGREVGGGGGEDADDHAERVVVEKRLRLAEDVVEADHVAKLESVIVTGVRERDKKRPVEENRKGSEHVGSICIVMDELHLQTDVAKGQGRVAVAIKQIATVHVHQKTNIERKNSIDVGSFVVSL